MTEGKPGAAAEFMNRWHLQEQESKKFRSLGGEESGEAWNVAIGDYSAPIYKSDFGTPTASGMVDSVRKIEQTWEPLGIEKTLASAIDDLLEKSDKRPLVLMDFGGGLGASWCILAHHFEQQVKSGELVFVVTNMEKDFQPQTVMERRVSTQDPNVVVVNYALDKNLVQYVEGELTSTNKDDIQSLRKTKVASGDEALSLYAGCDLVHTRMSLTHTNVPEIHYPRLMELISPQGIFIDSTFSSENKATPAHELGTNSEYTRKERQRVFDTFQYCQSEFGLAPVLTVEDGDHKDADLWITVLRKKDSPIKIES